MLRYTIHKLVVFLPEKLNKMLEVIVIAFLCYFKVVVFMRDHCDNYKISLVFNFGFLEYLREFLYMHGCDLWVGLRTCRSTKMFLETPNKDEIHSLLEKVVSYVRRVLACVVFWL